MKSVKSRELPTVAYSGNKILRQASSALEVRFSTDKGRHLLVAHSCSWFSLGMLTRHKETEAKGWRPRPRPKGWRPRLRRDLTFEAKIEAEILPPRRTPENVWITWCMLMVLKICESVHYVFLVICINYSHPWCPSYTTEM